MHRIAAKKAHYIRFGSKADIGACPRDVRFAPQKRTLDQHGRDVRFVPKADILRCSANQRIIDSFGGG
jgi:hypothetical protein